MRLLKFECKPENEWQGINAMRIEGITATYHCSISTCFKYLSITKRLPQLLDKYIFISKMKSLKLDRYRTRSSILSFAFSRNDIWGRGPREVLDIKRILFYKLDY